MRRRRTDCAVARPNRYQRRTLVPIGKAVIGETLDPLVEDIIRRIRGIRHRTQAGTHVLADAEGNVYVIADQASTTVATVREQAAMHVGLYADEDRRPTFPDVARMTTDLVAHFFRVGFLSQAMIYDEVRVEP